MNFKFMIDGEIVSEEEFYKEFESKIYNYVEENLDDFIDEENEEVCIGSCHYSPSQVLKEVDPIAYRCYLDDLYYHFYEEYKYELERFDEIEIDSVEFKIEEDEEDEEDEEE